MRQTVFVSLIVVPALAVAGYFAAYEPKTATDGTDAWGYLELPDDAHHLAEIDRLDNCDTFERINLRGDADEQAWAELMLRAADDAPGAFALCRIDPPRAIAAGVYYPHQMRVSDDPDRPGRLDVIVYRLPDDKTTRAVLFLVLGHSWQTRLAARFGFLGEKWQLRFTDWLVSDSGWRAFETIRLSLLFCPLSWLLACLCVRCRDYRSNKGHWIGTAKGNTPPPVWTNPILLLPWQLTFFLPQDGADQMESRWSDWPVRIKHRAKMCDTETAAWQLWRTFMQEALSTLWYSTALLKLLLRTVGLIQHVRYFQGVK